MFTQANIIISSRRKSYQGLGIKIARDKNEQVRKCRTDHTTREGQVQIHKI